MAHAIFRLILLSITLVLVRTAAAAPNALVVSETPLCRVSLTKVSYDGPGADDEEFIELFVERLGGTGAAGPPSVPDAPPPQPTCTSPHRMADSGAPPSDAAVLPDANADAASGKPILRDCGLVELRLVNGGGGACDEYRAIPLGPVEIPDDGYLVLCAQ